VVSLHKELGIIEIEESTYLQHTKHVFPDSSSTKLDRGICCREQFGRRCMSWSDALDVSTNQQEFTQEGKSNSDDEIQVWFVVETPLENHKCKKLKSMATPPHDVIDMVGRTIVTTMGAHRSETTTLEKEPSSSERTTTDTKPTAKRSWLPQPPLDAKKKND
ncbi:hypothetical protein Tco_1471499, partial [Tanacetum coccineum]